MLFSTIRFIANGWIEKLYLTPKFHFHYQGFEWVQVPGNFTYILFGILIVCSILISLGLFYKYAVSLFFLVFTYIELMDKTTYLNHYYFVSIISLVLIFLPANRLYSLDVKYNLVCPAKFIPKYNIDVLKVLIAIVYIYASLAKINYDWLINALPLGIWLPSKTSIPLIGYLFDQPWIFYAFSWAGMLFDTFIVFFLIKNRTRNLAFVIVVIFHLLTWILFPIGMFPFIMIFSVLIFFSPKFHEKILRGIARVMPFFNNQFEVDNKLSLDVFWARAQKVTIGVFLFIQLIFPWRYLCYDGNIFWNEMGYRFSWRVMLMEKAGHAQFKVHDTLTGNWFLVDNSDFLTPFQEKQMATQVDFIIEYAHILEDHFKKDGHKNMEITVDSYVSLNGRKSKVFVKPHINLLDFKQSTNFNDIIALPNE